VFNRLDESPDWLFYRQPRLVTHIDEFAIAAVSDLYRRWLPPGGAILDLMSSWVSHLPEDVAYGRVVGLGMNADELAANPRLDGYVVHDLNETPALPFAAKEFDAAVICVSIQYLTRPIEVLRDLARVLRPAAPVVITFSNRCFPTKAVAIWQALDDQGHVDLVTRYLEAAARWTNIHHENPPTAGDPLLAVIALAKLQPVQPEKEPRRD
jgi:SAM-dependent methyltransferase